MFDYKHEMVQFAPDKKKKTGNMKIVIVCNTELEVIIIKIIIMIIIKTIIIINKQQ